MNRQKKALSTSVKGALTYLGLHRFSALQLLLSQLLLLVTAPFVQDMKYGMVIEPLLGMLVLLSAILVVGGNRWARITSILLALPAVGSRLVYHFRPELLPSGVAPFFNLLFVGFITLYLIRFLFIAPRINAEVLYVGVSAYLLLGILWGFTYVLAERLAPGSILITTTSPSGYEVGFFDIHYFSFITLNTVGYGDFVPHSKTTKMLAILESTTGLFYMTILVARLVSLYTTGQVSNGKNNKE